MDSIQPSWLFQPQLPAHCVPTTPFLYKVSVYFGICLPTPLGFISTMLGGLSILSWLFAQVPQLFKNYQIKSAAGLSVYFLLEWLAGDLTNLIGGILTKQAGWQVLLAGYYTTVDILLTSQYFWYTYALPRLRAESIYSNGSDTDDDASSDLINSLSPINSSFHDLHAGYSKAGEEETSQKSHAQPIDTSRFSNISYEKRGESPSFLDQSKWAAASWTGVSPRTIMYAATLSSLATQVAAAPVGTRNNLIFRENATQSEVIGAIVSWCSTVLYTGSRLPQLYKNWRRKSTAGLAPLLFMAAFSGNLFYSASMLTNPNLWYNHKPYGGHGWAGEDGSTRGEFVTNSAPFFLGAFGVLFLDATVGIQFLMYTERQEKLVKVRDGRGSSRWQKVSGWMRGWIPTIRKEKVVDLAESQRLLSESRELDRQGHHSQYGGI